LFRFAPPSIRGLVFQWGQKKCVQGCKYVDVQANLALFWCIIRTSSIRQTLFVAQPQQRRNSSLLFKNRSRIRLGSRVPVRVFDRNDASDVASTDFEIVDNTSIWSIDGAMTPTVHGTVRTRHCI
jgi:hypothetical protein